MSKIYFNALSKELWDMAVETQVGKGATKRMAEFDEILNNALNTSWQEGYDMRRREG